MHLYIVLILLLFPTASFAQEARCTELGSDCTCSEPMNFDGAGFDFGSGGDCDFPDSPDATECTGIGGRGCVWSPGHGSPHGWSMVSGASAGLPEISRVLQRDYNVGPNGSFVESSRDFTDSTYCVRNYVRWSPEWPDATGPDFLATGDDDIKFGRWWGTGDSINAQSVWREAGWCVAHTSSTWNPPAPDITGETRWCSTANPRVSFLDCQNHWCRTEICWDHNSRSGADSKKLHYRMRMVDVTTGETSGFPSHLSNSSYPTASTGTTVKMFATTATDWKIHSVPNGAKSWHSHTMIAIKSPADENFWIGAASEIEGGDVGPPDPPDPPAAPVLLD